MLACVSWFKPHSCKDYYGKPITVWEPDIYEYDIQFPYLIRIHLIVGRTLFLKDTTDGFGNSLFVCPYIESEL